MGQKQIEHYFLRTSAVKPELFRKLVLFSVACFTLMWLINSIFHSLVVFNQLSYLISIIALASIYFLSVNNKVNNHTLLMLAYTVIAGFLISYSLWSHTVNQEPFLNSAQWLGLNYVMAYLFLDVKKAVPTTVIVFSITIVGHFLAIIANHSLHNTLGVVLSMGIAHTAYIALLWMVIKLRKNNEEVKQHAMTLEGYAYVDLLTHILNRRGIDKVIKDLGLNSDSNNQNYAILVVDIDHFKQVNDVHGHLIGDQILVKIASHLSRKVHPDDILGRWGGEEFIILTLNKDREKILALADYLRDTISQLDTDPVHGITASIGIGYSHEGKNTDEVFNIADKHLYTAKQIGRNRIIDSQLTH
ncbi:GGDEF domain-containing protein [Marinomonas sp. 15G1-11]|uniref:diguanylate cyclase n=1 Tax=Marinomonas phaeophyticola TaxID=3004091 RepID=A0ABT4JWE8_9GAMM|nr:GGDEF domain-containing protein [Marinomonas sp. 15G1-11]MCZ2721889.1 GGDEF domain-containing protein [Marinomonas sp. 15G1-11]